MIALADPGDPRLAAAPGDPLILAMIQALAKTAGPGLRREFWLALDGAGCPAGAVCRTESGVWATALEEAAAETAAFLQALGTLPGTADRRLAPLLPGGWEPFPVLEYRGPLPEKLPLAAPSAMGLADCNIAAGAVPPGVREELYAELHLRFRRGAARIVLVPDETGDPVAGAAAFLGAERAVVGYLACVPQKRGQGYGAAALAAIVREAMEQGYAPILACRKELVPFYARRGFATVGEVWESQPI